MGSTGSIALIYRAIFFVGFMDSFFPVPFEFLLYAVKYIRSIKTKFLFLEITETHICR
jgi:hypothetical protein